jgi:hypothetical protein
MMPELYEVVGPSIFLKIINVFGGTNLEIPTHKDLKSAIRDVHIYNTLSKVPICDQHKYAARLGKHHDVVAKDVLAIYERVRKEISDVENNELLLKCKRDSVNEEDQKALDLLFDGEEIDNE